MYSSDNNITLFKGKYNLLIPIKIINNNFYYMIGYIDENNIHFLFFKFEISTLQNILLLYNKSILNFFETDKSFIINNNLLT